MSKDNATETNHESDIHDIIDPIAYNDPVENYIANKLVKMRFAELRQQSHVTQKRMSELSGLSVQTVSDIESSTSGNPTLKSIQKYLDTLGYELRIEKKICPL